MFCDLDLPLNASRVFVSISWASRRSWFKTRISADADKLARRDYSSVKVIKHRTFRYVRYSFL